MNCSRNAARGDGQVGGDPLLDLPLFDVEEEPDDETKGTKLSAIPPPKEWMDADIFGFDSGDEQEDNKEGVDSWSNMGTQEERNDRILKIAQDHVKDLELCLATSGDCASLSDFQVLVRENLYFFEATQTDIEKGVRGRKPIKLGQVGICCGFCGRMLPRPPGTAYYPSGLSQIYYLAQKLAKNHLMKDCWGQFYDEESFKHNMKEFAKTSMVETRKKGTLLKYWEETAEAKGIYEVEGGGLRLYKTK